MVLEYLLDPTLVLVFRIVVGIFLAVSGFLKIIDLKGFVYIVEKYGEIVQRFGRIPAYILPFAELIVGVMLLAGFYLAIASGIAMLMAVLFGAMVASALIKHKKLENCGCFGAKFKKPITWKSLVEDIVFFLLSLLIFLSAYPIAL